MSGTPLASRIRTASVLVAAAALLAGRAQDAAGQGVDVDGLREGAPVWRAGVEMGRAPALRLGWETFHGPWIVGAATGLGPGSGGVDIRLTPAIRLGRRLSRAFRVDGALGFEWARLADTGNAHETEIQWELTGAWMADSGWEAEAGVRRTDYGHAAWEPLVRVRAPASWLGAAPPMPPPPAGAPHPFGAPRPVAEGGRLELGVEAPVRRGHGALLAASNPRGDADPWRGQGGPNVDRLGVRAEVWSERGPLAAWARWSSDLHMDPSIAARVAPVAAGAGFPVTVSFSGGATWSDAAGGNDVSVAVRHDPKVFLWMPHLGEERTARVEAVSAEARIGRMAVSARRGALDPIEGRSLQPLEHLHLDARSQGRWGVGIEHERVAWGREGSAAGSGARSATRAAVTRAAVTRRGALRARLAAGSDVVLRLGIGPRHGRSHGAAHRAPASPWAPASHWMPVPAPAPDSSSATAVNPVRSTGFWAGADLEVRSAPALLDHEALLGRGWMAAEDEGDGSDDGAVAVGSFSAGWGPLGVEAAAGRGLPVRSGSSTRRADGGRVDALLITALRAIPARAHVRLRLAEWGPAWTWWREEATLEAHLELPIPVGDAGEFSVELYGRSALHGARSELHERGGVEATVALAVPVPTGPLGAAGRAEARLEDVFDRGLPLRIGAPTRGRRLTILVLLADLE